MTKTYEIQKDTKHWAFEDTSVDAFVVVDGDRIEDITPLPYDEQGFCYN